MKYKIAVCDDIYDDAQYIASVVSRWAKMEYIPEDVPDILCGSINMKGG